jgi:hypothetical protein
MLLSNGRGDGDGYGNGRGRGNSYGDGYGDGNGDGYGYGKENPHVTRLLIPDTDPVLSVAYQSRLMYDIGRD